MSWSKQTLNLIAASVLAALISAILSLGAAYWAVIRTSVDEDQVIKIVDQRSANAVEVKKMIAELAPYVRDRQLVMNAAKTNQEAIMRLTDSHTALSDTMVEIKVEFGRMDEKLNILLQDRGLGVPQ